MGSAIRHRPLSPQGAHPSAVLRPDVGWFTVSDGSHEHGHSMALTPPRAAPDGRPCVSGPMGPSPASLGSEHWVPGGTA